MPTISTLIPDVYKLLGTKGWFTDELADEFAASVAKRVQQQFSDAEADRKGTLRLSQMGPRCPRALWYSVHNPELAEPLPPWAMFKYTYGHIIEALAITLAKAAGHEVTGEQDAVYVDGIKGHRDCVIDGCIVDVKSTSSLSFDKFKTGTLKEADSFGYLDQLDGYLVGSLEDDLVRVKDVAYDWAIDKQLGKMCVYEHRLREQSIRERIRNHKAIVALDQPPRCTCETVPDGRSGNIKLGIAASYSPYKFCCFPNLRTFLYSKGPVYLTEVKRLPDVPEIDQDGKIVHNHQYH